MTWLQCDKHILEKYEPKDIYNMDETGIFCNMLPNHIFGVWGKKCHTGKHSKERLTVVLCTNMDGSDKGKLVVIRKYAKPSCFKDVDPNNFLVIYEYNTNAWMTREYLKHV
jgi:hypothetical protein